VGALGQPHRAWEGFHADPNLVFADPCQLLQACSILELGRQKLALGEELLIRPDEIPNHGCLTAGAYCTCILPDR
jgi:hypothetical protein